MQQVEIVRVSVRHLSTISEQSEISLALLSFEAWRRLRLIFRVADRYYPNCRAVLFLQFDGVHRPQGEDSATTTSGFFGPLTGGNVSVDFQPTHGLATAFSQCRPATGDSDLGAILRCVKKLSAPSGSRCRISDKGMGDSVRRTSWIDLPALLRLPTHRVVRLPRSNKKSRRRQFEQISHHSPNPAAWLDMLVALCSAQASACAPLLAFPMSPLQLRFRSEVFSHSPMPHRCVPSR